ncbi:extracellular solute-binding protein [Pannonibacter tanglangensis]|uniref:sn-glycerol-3-phosphate-binding periplasmic protein UgpB n=1 Tax=Pannonibacter tanglangensis TaxID=2750084 RepID=A0ABW9ZR85_9HYPH|nr:extracellular solute-binding protein [Pannonibacter sp. XCT-34]NBN66066.1 extracellular solute-binding protein [Pannonibacter sp. XCT-34]
MSFRKFVAGTVAAAALAGFSAPAFAATQISFWHGMGGRNGEILNELATKFNAAQSACVLTPVSKGNYEEALASGIAAFRSGQQPNVLQVFDAGAATIINAKGATVAAEDLLREAGYPFKADDYIQGVRYFYADAAGKFVGMPLSSSAPIMYYNVDALKKAGVEAPKTWEEFEAIAPKLKDAGFIPLVQSHLPWQMVENFHSRNNLPFATNSNGFGGVEGTKILVNTPEQRKMFEKLVAWKDQGLFGFFGAGWNENQKPFEEGKVALWIGSSGSFGGLQKTATMPFGATFLPYWEGIKGAGTNSFIGGAALFAMAGKPAAENKCTADFFHFLSSPDIQYWYHKTSGYVPITSAAYELAKKDGYYQQTPAAEVGIKQLMLPGGEWSKGYRMGFYPQIRDVMNREFGKVFSGQTKVEDAFKTIEDEANQILARFAKTAG